MGFKRNIGPGIQTDDGVLTVQGSGDAQAAHILSATPGNPPGTTSAVGVMAGLNQTITPKVSGQLLVMIGGFGGNATAGDGFLTRLRWGTGAAPTNGAALTGTIAGNPGGDSNSVVAANAHNFCIVALITGLTLGTTYWLDLSEAAITGGAGHTASLTSIVVTALEVLGA